MINNDILKNAQDYFKSKKGLAVMAAIFCIGLFCVFAGNLFAEKADGEAPSTLSEYNLDQYTKQLETQMTQMVRDISGTGNVKVMITLESSFENVFASNASIDESGKETQSRTTQKELVLSNSGNEGDVPVVIKQLYPKINGVIIVCDGGDDAVTKEKIISAASVAFRVSTNRIYVTGGKTKSPPK